MLRSGWCKGVWLAFGAALAFGSTGLVRAQAPADGAAGLVLRALALLETPYRYGGRTPAGFDCSGFVGFVFSEAAGVALPRRSEDIGRTGERLDLRDLAAGDLVFFNTLGRRFSHVGIFIGDDRFVHAPTRGGKVRVERLSDAYWTARYNGARRVAGLQPVAPANAVPSDVAAAAAVYGSATGTAGDLHVTP